MLQKENYNLQVELHERAIEILELYWRALKRLSEAKDLLSNYDKATRTQRMMNFYDRSHYTWQVKVKERSVSFLTRLYARHSAKICSSLAPVQSSPKHTTVKPVEVPELQAANSFGSGFGDFVGHVQIYDPSKPLFDLGGKDFVFPKYRPREVMVPVAQWMQNTYKNLPDFLVCKDDTLLLSDTNRAIYDDHHTN